MAPGWSAPADADERLAQLVSRAEAARRVLLEAAQDDRTEARRQIAGEGGGVGWLLGELGFDDVALVERWPAGQQAV